MAQARILVADDDARWEHLLVTGRREIHFQFVANMEDALGLIDRRRRWTGGIFDRYLLVGDYPFSVERLAPDAGFVLAAAFLERFPERRACVCSGQTLPRDLEEPWLRLLESDRCSYVFKGDHDSTAQTMNYVLRGSRPSRSFSTWLNYLLLEPNFFGFGINLRNLRDARKRAIQKDRKGSRG